MSSLRATARRPPAQRWWYEGGRKVSEACLVPGLDRVSKLSLKPQQPLKKRRGQILRTAITLSKCQSASALTRVLKALGVEDEQRRQVAQAQLLHSVRPAHTPAGGW